MRANGPEAGGEDTEGKGAEERANTQKGHESGGGDGADAGQVAEEDWDNDYAEAYAILRYLRSVVDRSADPAQERVPGEGALVMSDSRAVLDVIETICGVHEMRRCARHVTVAQ